jgi:hypothetical protein
VHHGSYTGPIAGMLQPSSPTSRGPGRLPRA